MPGTPGFIRKFTGPTAWSSVSLPSSTKRSEPSAPVSRASENRMRKGPLPWPSESIASVNE